MKRTFKSKLTEIKYPDDASSGSWGDMLLITILGLIMTSLFGYLFVGLFYEWKSIGRTLPPIIFSGLMTIGGIIMLLDGLIEIPKKIFIKEEIIEKIL